MKINVKTVKGETIPFEAEAATTIQELKTQIAGKLNVEVGNQKLIFKGKHLEDAKSLAELNVKDEDCFILMVMKVRLSRSQQTSRKKRSRSQRQ